MRFVHAADLHIDSPLVGLERYEGAPVAALRGATRRALENLVALCIAEDAKLLLLAGDLFDGAWRDFNTGLFFVAQMKRLRDAQIPVVIARGNHDAASRIPKQLRLPDNVHELPTDEAATIPFEAIDVAVHGRSYPTHAVTEDLAARYPASIAGALNIGVLHTALDGRPGHDTYAPTTVNRLVDRGYDYWALGHVHGREIVRRDPWIVFPGNLQGRHVQERGAKGATVIEIAGRRVVEARHAPLDVARFEALHVPVAMGGSSDDAIERAAAAVTDAHAAADGRLLCADVVFRGTPEEHATRGGTPDRWAGDVRAAVLDAASGGAWVARVRFEVDLPEDDDALAARTDALGRLAAAARACAIDDALAAPILAAARDPQNKLDPVVTAGAVPDPTDGAARARFFAEVEELVRAKLRGAPARASER